MNPFQFKSSIFSLVSPTSEREVFVVVLNKYCVLEDEKCFSPLLLPTATPSPNGMEMGFHIMGKSENIGSNIIFSSMPQQKGYEGKKNCQAPSLLTAKGKWGGGKLYDAPRFRGSENRSLNINSIPNREEKKIVC